jgi:hypothetical protein
MPLMGKLPAFVTDRQQQCAWPGRRELPEGLDLPAESRVKAFRFGFMRDYRDEACLEQAATLTFVYVSGAGRGLQVLLAG